MERERVKVKILILIAILFLIFSIPSVSKASFYLKNEQLRNSSEEEQEAEYPEKIGFSIGVLNENTSNLKVASALWKFVKYANQNAETGEDKINFYCVKASTGFLDPAQKYEYVNSYDFINQRTDMKGVSGLQSIVNDNLNSNTIDKDPYYAIIALSDLMYIKGTMTESGVYTTNGASTEQDKALLLRNAGITDNKLTDNMIDAIQQAVIWYFTDWDNKDFDRVYDRYKNGAQSGEEATWFTYTDETKHESVYKYSPITDYKSNSGLGEDLGIQVRKLYDYLIKTTIANIPSYKTGALKSKNKITLYTNKNVENTQPVIVIQKVKSFDLALRKYITKVGDTELAKDNRTRMPDIDETKIATNGTADYKHRKDPVQVKTGDIITYNITVYNEGEKAGCATKIIDQLPDGLHYEGMDTATAGKFDAVYDDTNNKVTFTRKSGRENQDKLEAYTEGDPHSETLTITCKVTQKPIPKTQKVLTNVAWIEEEYDAVDSKKITSQEGDDRDSEPSNSPATDPVVTKSNMDNYKGKDNNENVSNNPNGYWQGRQDDDDFEKLVVIPSNFDLALRKYITQVNDTVLKNNNQTREPNIDETKIATNKTADYKHRKDPVEVQKGDIITYNITVYNEGDRAGYPMEIIDQLPEGLHYEGMDEGTKLKFNDNYDSANNKVTFTRKAEREKEDKLVAYTQGKPASETLTIKCKVTQNPDAQQEIVLTNVAWISKEYNSDDDQEITDQEGYDIDSEPLDSPATDTPKVTKDNITAYNGHDENKGDNNNAEQLKDNNYFFKGREDDDDFEKLVVKPKKFDLALRKYITKVGNTVLAENNRTRIPDIDEIKIATNGTADYKHRKDPVEVKTEDIVTYNITIYNEGEKAGYATKIIDQLPDGLHYERMDAATTEKFDDDYDDVNNKVTFTRKGTRSDKLNAYTSGDPDSETLTITCKVTQEPDVRKRKVLTNVAWIEEEYDAVDEKEITNKVGDDRDSEPSTSPATNPGVAKDNMENYKGKDTNKDVSNNPNGYWEGRQDDDDFEKLVVMPENNFDLRLKKTIYDINGTQVEERIKSVNVDALKAKTSTDADIQMNKDPIKVKKGDIVKYRIRVYNEGDIDGYAKQISEDIPEGLELIYSDDTEEQINQNTTLSEAEKNAILYNKSIWTPSVKNQTTQKVEMVTTNYLAKGEGLEKTQPGANLIKAFNKAKDYIDTAEEKNPDYRDIYIYMKVIAENVSGNIIRNEAAITDDSDENGEEIDDRDSNPKDSQWDREGNPPKYEDDEDYDNIILEVFDLSLRKFIAGLSKDVTVEESDYLKKTDGKYVREPEVDTSLLDTEGTDGKIITTAKYNHPKDPLLIDEDDYIIYTIRVYNEGDIHGYASEIIDYLPDGLDYVDCDFNKAKGWQYDETTRTIKTTYLADKLIEAREKLTVSDTNANRYKLDFEDVQIMCKLNGKVDVIQTNMAEITKDKDKDNKEVDDRDSQPDNFDEPDEDKKPTFKEEIKDSYVPGDQDDDDFEKVQVKEKPFDLSLRKFIAGLSKDVTVEESDYLKKTDGKYVREPEVDTSLLDTEGTDGKIITTAKYNHPKDPVYIDENDYIIYTIRVYNEGDIAGYASEIIDYLPDGLDYVDCDFNKTNGWQYDETTRTIKTTILNNKLIEARKELTVSSTNANRYELDYEDVQIMCKLKADSDIIQTNMAEITKDKDKDDKEVEDRDSKPDNFDEPSEDKKPTFKEEIKDSYVPGDQDDDDFEKVQVKEKPFDLALRKFITKIQDQGVTSRIPQVKYDAENQKITYEHGKDPLEVGTGMVVEYTIRVFNEGARDGYAAQVLDDIPEGLKFLPDNETNTEYRWKMYRKLREGETVAQIEGQTIVQDGQIYVKTENAEEADVIVTDYLSMEQGAERMNNNETDETTENPALLKAFDPNAEISDTNPEYKDVKVAFEVVEPNTSDKIIVNSAQISKDTDEKGNEVEDTDSEPGKWTEGEDDQDKEYLKLTYFDLALRKWVTQAIVIENGKQTVTQTGHTPEQDPEPIVKVDLDRKKLDSVTVKFRYSIRITNQGDIAGYAKEITDYVPEGLKFLAEDNPGWTDAGNNVIKTNLLADRLLQPGESADIEVVLTWINAQDNMGLKTNTAEISEDYNDRGIPDRDSTPDNKKPGEDDIDDAPVMLSVKTGQIPMYTALGFSILSIIAGGVTLIKKFVI